MAKSGCSEKTELAGEYANPDTEKRLKDRAIFYLLLEECNAHRDVCCHGENWDGGVGKIPMGAIKTS